MASTAVTIGAFDGVHAGHASLIARARRHAGEDGRVIAMAFFPHPLTALAPERAPAVLTPLEEKRRVARALGVDEVRVLAPEDGVLSLTPEAFVERVVGEVGPSWVVEGDDFRFGAKRAGTVETLAELGDRFGFGVDVAPAVEVELADQSLVRASSTVARWLIRMGRVEEASRVLGRPYRLFGVAGPGAQRGRGLGFRTANLAVENLAPGEGVYAATALLPSGEERPAAVSIGKNETFEPGDAPVSVEAHVLDWEGEGAPEYGYTLALDFHAWVREQRVYSEIGALVDQISRDVERVRAVCAAAGEGAVA